MRLFIIAMGGSRRANKQSIKVSVADVLEVRQGPLQEPEIWSLLALTGEALQDLLLKS